MPDSAEAENRVWWLRSLGFRQGTSFLPLYWTVVTTNASLPGWGDVLELGSVQGRWILEESTMPIDILGLQAIRLCMDHGG